MAYAPPPVQNTPTKKSNTALIVVIVAVVGICLVLPVMAAILFPVFSQAKLGAKRSIAMRQAKDISRFLMIYAMDNDGYMPHQFETQEDLYFSVVIYSSSGVDFFDTHNPSGGVFMPNPYLAGVNLNDVLSPEGTILIFESAPWDGQNGRVVSFLNGQVMYMKPFNESQVFPPRLASGGESQR